MIFELKKKERENETFFPFETFIRIKMFISPEICIILFTTSLMRDMVLSAFSWKLRAKLIFFSKLIYLM